MAENVFVYGTLMRGQQNYRWLLKDNPDARFVGEGRAEGLALYAVTPGYPGVIRERGAVTVGEVFRVGPKVLRKMDRLEGEGELYIREKTIVKLKNGPVVEAWVYLWNRTPDPATRVPEDQQPWRKKKLGGRRKQGKNLPDRK